MQLQVFFGLMCSDHERHALLPCTETPKYSLYCADRLLICFVLTDYEGSVHNLLNHHVADVEFTHAHNESELLEEIYYALSNFDPPRQCSSEHMFPVSIDENLRRAFLILLFLSRYCLRYMRQNFQEHDMPTLSDASLTLQFKLAL